MSIALGQLYAHRMYIVDCKEVLISVCYVGTLRVFHFIQLREQVMLTVNLSLYEVILLFSRLGSLLPTKKVQVQTVILTG